MIEKSENNQLWDCFQKEKKDTIPEDFYIFDPAKGSQTRYYRFEDGSFVKIVNTLNDSIEVDGSEESSKLLKEKIKDEKLLNKVFSHNPNKSKASEFSTNGLETGTGYDHYYDYRVELVIGTMYASMITEFFIINGGPDYLIPSGFFGPTAVGFGELVQMPTIEIIREQENESMSRWALANSHWYVNYPISTPWGGSSLSGTKYLWLGVGNNSYRVSDRLPY